MKARNAERGTRRKGAWILAVLIAFSFQLSAFSSPALASEKTFTMAIYKYDSTTGVTYYTNSGVTTDTKQTASGVSAMARRSGPVGPDLKGDTFTIDLRESGGYALFRIRSLETSAAAAGVSTGPSSTSGWNRSGTTFYAYYKAVWENTSAAWDSAELIPIMGPLARSGNTPDPVWTQTDPANFMRTYFRPSGVTAWGEAQMDVVTGIDRSNMPEPKPVCVGERIYTPMVTPPVGGVSSFAQNDDSGSAIPAGARWAVIQPAASGNSVYYTTNAAVNRNADQTIAAGDAMPVGGSAGELKRYVLGSGATNTKALVKFYNRRPY